MRTISEKELFGYLKENQTAAKELYQALSGDDANESAEIEVRENADTYFLAKKNGAIFTFAKKNGDTF